MIVSGATEYRQFMAAASKQRYAIRFSAVGHSTCEADEDADELSDQPELLAGVRRAPPHLSVEMADLIRFKTSTLTAIGFQRQGVWGDETAAQKHEHLGLLFGALAASPRAAVQGRGVPRARLTFALLAFPAVWDWYLQ